MENNIKRMNEIIVGIKDFYPDLILAVNAYMSTEEDTEEMLRYLINNNDSRVDDVLMKALDIANVVY